LCREPNAGFRRKIVIRAKRGLTRHCKLQCHPRPVCILHTNSPVHFQLFAANGGLSIVSAAHGPRHGNCTTNQQGNLPWRGLHAESLRDKMKTLLMKGCWNIAKGKLKQKMARWAEDGIEFSEGKRAELVGRIQKRAATGRENREPCLDTSCGCKRQAR
jgi:uncharacterized protein YjbJ (UPF0337 family)